MTTPLAVAFATALFKAKEKPPPRLKFATDLFPLATVCDTTPAKDRFMEKT
jgi:hypothetical protein